MIVTRTPKRFKLVKTGSLTEMRITVDIHPLASAIAVDQLLKWARQVEGPSETVLQPSASQPSGDYQEMFAAFDQPNTGITVLPEENFLNAGPVGALSPGDSTLKTHNPQGTPLVLPAGASATIAQVGDTSLTTITPAPAAAAVASGAASTDASPKPRIRRTKAQIEADKAAEAAAKTTLPAPVQEEFLPPGSPGPVHTLPSAPPASAATLPPELAGPMSALPPLPPLATASVVPAPSASPVNSHGTMGLEDFRAAIAAINKARQGLPMNVMRQPQFLDGTPHAAWWTIESVPAELRSHLIADLQAQMMA